MSIHLCCIDIILYLSHDVVMLFTSYTASTIVQIFPENVDYSCLSPSIKPKCTFTENPLTAFWTLFAGGRVPMQVTVSTPGHTVDPSEIQNGPFFLKLRTQCILKTTATAALLCMLMGIQKLVIFTLFHWLKVSDLALFDNVHICTQTVRLGSCTWLTKLYCSLT